MTRSEKIDKIVEQLEEETDFTIMKEVKATLNKVFGEENNQIAKPTYDTINRICLEEGMGGSFSTYVDSLSAEDLMRWLKRNIHYSLFYQIIIKFPEVKITNGEADHIIKELYVRVCISPEGKIQPYISGTRGSLTLPEIRSRYAHSHLPGCNPHNMEFQPFCTGVGPINQVMLLLANKYTYPNFMMFCLNIKTFVAWESKEGRPHMYLENINKIGEGSVHLSDNYALEIAEDLISEIEMPFTEIYSLADWTISSTKVVAKMNNNFEKWAARKMLNWDIDTKYPGLSKNSFFNTKDNSGRYYALPTAEDPSYLFNTSVVILHFKGQDITLKVDLPKINETEIISDEEKVPNQAITKHVGKKLTKYLSQTAFGSTRIRTGCASVD